MDFTVVDFCSSLGKCLGNHKPGPKFWCFLKADFFLNLYSVAQGNLDFFNMPIFDVITMPKHIIQYFKENNVQNYMHSERAVHNYAQKRLFLTLYTAIKQDFFPRIRIVYH